MQARFDAAQVEMHGEAREWSRTGDEGGTTTFWFCGTCGATVLYALDGLPDARAIPVWAFADPSFPPPTVDVYTARQHPWVELTGDVEHWE